MLISHTKKFIFIHTYKTAGTSMRNALLPFSDFSRRTKNPVKFINYLLKRYPSFYSNSVPAHSTALTVKNKLGVDFDSYYSFAFVRNPWDWQVSLYSYMLKDINHHQHKLITDLENFENYIRWRCENEVRFQKDFICDSSGKKVVNFVGKFENLQNDFNVITSQIGIAPIQLSHLNKSNSTNYRSFYTEETKELVRTAFKKDIEFFNYEF